MTNRISPFLGTPVVIVNELTNTRHVVRVNAQPEKIVWRFARRFFRAYERLNVRRVECSISQSEQNVTIRVWTALPDSAEAREAVKAVIRKWRIRLSRKGTPPQEVTP